MTTTYVRLTDTDKPESQTAITASFVDETGKHIDIGGGGTTEIHTDTTLAGTGTGADPLKLSDTTSEDIAKAKTITEDNLVRNGQTGIDPAYNGSAQIVLDNYYKMYAMSDAQTITGKDLWGYRVFTVPAIAAIKNVTTLDSSAGLTDVVNKVNEILNAVKNAH